MTHYTKKFKDAYDRVLKVLEAEGEEAGKLAFREEMLKLGHTERVLNLYRIQDKLSRKAVFFRLNKAQKKVLKDKASRKIILKCRQIGFTTLSCIRGLDYALWEPNTRAGILCHLQRTVETIFKDITKFSYNWYKRDWGHLYLPTEKSSSTTTLAFEDDGLGRSLESSIRVMFDFRGKTVNYLHVSEASRVEDERLIGSLQGVPATGEVIYESTANGMDGDFYHQWQNWREEGPLAPYKGFFVPWYEHYPESAEDWKPTKDFKFTEYEAKLLKDYPNKIKKRHVMWRRWCVRANCAGDSERFENEYPTNDFDCFASNQSSVFPGTLIKRHMGYTKPAQFVGFLIMDGKKVETYEDKKGYLSIWEYPTPDKSYVVGADPAGGVGKDRGAAFVKDQKTGKLVARLWCDIDPSEFARELYKLAKFYNGAWLCVESNNHGGTVIQVLKEIGYTNLYKRHAVDELSNKPTKKIGFLTTNQSKLMITEKFKTAAKEGKVIIPDVELLKEMTKFVQTASKTGKLVKREAISGGHDDLVMAASLTEEMDQSRGFIDPLEWEVDRALPDYDDDYVFDSETGFIK